MKILSTNIPTSLGDLILIKSHLDIIKDDFEQINLTYQKDGWSNAFYTTDHSGWNKFLDEITQLFFSEKPYTITQEHHPFVYLEKICTDNGIVPFVRPNNIKHILCKGTPLNVGDYLVITTKVRSLTNKGFDKNIFESKKNQFLGALKTLSSKYKLVILGEKKVELRREYDHIKDNVFSLYDDYIQLPNVLDLTVPALGETAANMSQVCQDCMIMSQARATITFGHGGNTMMSIATSKYALGYRIEHDILLSQQHDDMLITSDWDVFMQEVNSL